MAGIRLRDKRLAKRVAIWARDEEHRTLFVPGSQYVLFENVVLTPFLPA
jgi:hypothetical protein